jgi:hypothetical protein
MALGVASLVVAVLAVAVALRQELRTGRLQHRMAELEEARRADEVAARNAAQLRAFATGDLEASPQMAMYMGNYVAIIIVNDGSHDATDIDAYLDAGGDDMDRTHIDRIVARQRYRATFSGLHSLPFTITMEWSDGRPGRQIRTMEVNTSGE